MLELEFTAKASADLDDILAYSVNGFGLEVASRYYGAIYQVIEQIREYPQSGQRVPRLRPQLRSIGTGSHRVYYRPGANKILVVRILHQSRSLRGQFSD